MNIVPPKKKCYPRVWGLAWISRSRQYNIFLVRTANGCKIIFKIVVRTFVKLLFFCNFENYFLERWKMWKTNEFWGFGEQWRTPSFRRRRDDSDAAFPGSGDQNLPLFGPFFVFDVSSANCCELRTWEK